MSMMIILEEYALYLSLAYFGLLLLCMEFGRRVGRMRLACETPNDQPGTAAIEGAIFALLGLLVAFTFSGAAGRFDGRRELIVQEANAIGTAYLRIDLVSSDLQVELREAFHRYVESRALTYQVVHTAEEFQSAQERNSKIQSEIWELAVTACRRPDAVQGCTVALLPALNDMIDITTTRALAMQRHPPNTVYLMLLVLSLVCAVIAGYGMRKASSRSWLHMIAFSAILTVTIYVTIDLEYPRLGYIKIGTFENALQGAVK